MIAVAKCEIYEGDMRQTLRKYDTRKRAWVAIVNEVRDKAGTMCDKDFSKRSMDYISDSAEEDGVVLNYTTLDKADLYSLDELDETKWEIFEL